MLNLRSKLTAVFLSIAGLTSSVQADCWDPCNDCCIDFEIGADWLYWTPCINDQHFACVQQNEETPIIFKEHYLCDEWDSGVRVYGKVGNLWNDFGGALAYTYFKPSAKGSVSSSLEGSIILTNASPISFDEGEKATSDWELEYQTIDAVLSYSVDVCNNPCLKVEAFSGLTWVDVTNDRTDVMYTDEDSENEIISTFKRHNCFWAVGPTFGLNTSYRVCDCFNLFGTFQTSLVVGESENKDIVTFEGNLGGFAGEWHAKDECFCFPGLHLVAGIEYELCLCDCEFGIRLGWEYVQWINAPTFPFYEDNDDGIRSAPSTNDLTMQGIFVGLFASF